jgi:hypothetical protein
LLLLSIKTAHFHRCVGIAEKRIDMFEEPRGIIEHDEVPGGVGQDEVQLGQFPELLSESLDERRPGMRIIGRPWPKTSRNECGGMASDHANVDNKAVKNSVRITSAERRDADMETLPRQVSASAPETV